MFLTYNVLPIYAKVNYYRQGIPKRTVDDPRITKNYRMSGPPVSERSAVLCILQEYYVPLVNFVKQNCAYDFLFYSLLLVVSVYIAAL